VSERDAGGAPIRTPSRAQDVRRASILIPIGRLDRDAAASTRDRIARPPRSGLVGDVSSSSARVS
jgi:hypothetical protein